MNFTDGQHKYLEDLLTSSADSHCIETVMKNEIYNEMPNQVCTLVVLAQISDELLTSAKIVLCT